MLASMVIAPAMRRGDGTDQDVAVADVPKFVREDAFEFFVIQQFQNAVRHCDRRVLRVASRGEGVRRLGRDHIHLRHRNADLLRQALDRSVGARQFFARDRLRAIHRQRDLVGVEIRDEVHDGSEGQRQKHPILSAEESSNEHQEQREGGQQERGLESVSHNFEVAISLDVRRRGEMHEAHFGNCRLRARYPPPPGSIGIMELAENLRIIYAAQSLAGKIFRNKELANIC